MTATCCPFIKPDGAPCAARPLPNSAFCLFHDPDHQQALTESRSKGGSTPRRRTRRFPRLLDHVHVAELLGELFIDALNNPDAINTKRLQALTNLSRVLLTAVAPRPPSSSTRTAASLLPPLATSSASTRPSPPRSRRSSPPSRHPTPAPSPPRPTGRRFRS